MYDIKSLAYEVQALRTILYHERAALFVKRELVQPHPASESCLEPEIRRFTYRSVEVVYCRAAFYSAMRYRASHGSYSTRKNI